MELIFKQVWQLVVGLFFSQSPLTAVSCNELPAAAEMIDGQAAVVGTALTFCHGGRVFKGFYIFDRKHGRALTVHIPLPGNESSAESPHDSGDIRTYSLTACNLLEAPEYGVVVKRTALHDDMVPKLGRIGHLDYLEQCILNDRVGKSRRDIGNRRPFFLRLFYLRVHENRTACAKVNGILGK